MALEYTYKPGDKTDPFVVVSLADAKKNSNIEYNEDDGFLQVILNAALDFVERHTGIDVVSRDSGEVEVNSWANKMELPCGPVRSIDKIEYYDADNQKQELSASDYSLKLYYGESHPVVQINQSEWPALSSKKQTPIIITVNTGYQSPDEVPASIKQAILLYFTKNEAVREDTELKGDRAVKALLSSFKRRD